MLYEFDLPDFTKVGIYNSGEGFITDSGCGCCCTDITLTEDNLDVMILEYTKALAELKKLRVDMYEKCVLESPENGK